MSLAQVDLKSSAEKALSFVLNPMPPALSPKVAEMLAGAEVGTIGHWRHWGFCDRELKRLTSGSSVIGTAVTVACPPEDNAVVHYATGLLRPGDILVIDRLNNRDVACFGEVVMRACAAAGAVAVILDGPCTDSRAIAEAGFPLWCRGVSPRTTSVRGIAGRLNTPVCVGGVIVNPGDILLCDDDGVLVLPPDEVEAEATRAAERAARAQRTQQRLRAGEKLPDINDARRLIEHGLGQK